jgi:hypothetical protein
MDAKIPKPNPDSIILPETKSWPQYMSNLDLYIMIPDNGLSFTVTQNALPYVAGFKVDEWTDFIPNLRETTAMAFQYETPQAEAPQVILLVIPPVSNSTTWDGDKLNDELAEIIADTIDLMRIRAVSAEAVCGSKLGNLLPALFFSNLPGPKSRFPTNSLPLFAGVVAERFDYSLEHVYPFRKCDLSCRSRF